MVTEGADSKLGGRNGTDRPSERGVSEWAHLHARGLHGVEECITICLGEAVHIVVLFDWRGDVRT